MDLYIQCIQWNTVKYYLENDLDGEESSEDVVCIAQDLKSTTETVTLSAICNKEKSKIWIFFF